MVPVPEPCPADSKQTVGPDILIRTVCGKRSCLIALAASATTSSRPAGRSGQGRPLNQAAAALGTARMPTSAAGPVAGPIRQPSAPGPEKACSDVIDDIHQPGIRVALPAQPGPQAVVFLFQQS